MKKIIMYIIFVFFIIFTIPAICTKKKEVKSEDNKAEIKNEKKESEIEKPKAEVEKYDYKKFATIYLYHNKTSEIEKLPIDEYLYGVVSSEIPVKYNIEALKAQAIAARTYTIYQIIHSKQKHGEADICDNYACCQAWISKQERLEKWNSNEAEANWNKIQNAVNSTQGKIITYNNEPIDAFFHSNSGGTTEIASNVWGGENYPYLQSVETAGEDNYSEYFSELELSQEELLNKLKLKYKDIKINFNEENCIEIKEYTEAKRVKTIKFGNIEIAGTEARSIFGLKSTNFSIEINNNKIKFVVLGYGHGVGMSQTGANSLAQKGYNCAEILNHFYKGIEIESINDL